MIRMIPRTPRETPRPIRIFLADLRSSDNGRDTGVPVLLLIMMVVIDRFISEVKLSAELVGKEVSSFIWLMEDAVVCLVVETLLSPTV